jgi:chromate transporter
MIYLQLFLSYLKIGFFGFGGGYAMISLIQNEVVVRNNWLTSLELADIVAISQMTPGPIAINCATYVGYTVTGNIWGSLLATFAVCLPPLTIMTLITIFYRRLHNNYIVKSTLSWMRPIMTGMIGAAALMFLNRDTFVDWVSIVIFVVSFFATWKKFNPILLLIMAAVAGIIIY